MTFCERAWTENGDLYDAIAGMPYNVELRDGVLRAASFRHYIIQDGHCLEGFARALAMATARAPSPEHVAMLAKSAARAIEVERGLHASFFRTYGIGAEEFEANRATPICQHYISYLITTAATADFPVIVAALLPRFWIYMGVGKSIHASSARANPYQAWIEAYAGAEFEEAVRRTMALADELAASSSGSTVLAMFGAVRDCTRLEWMFWDSAYRSEGWPIWPGRLSAF